MALLRISGGLLRTVLGRLDSEFSSVTQEPLSTEE